MESRYSNENSSVKCSSKTSLLNLLINIQLQKVLTPLRAVAQSSPTREMTVETNNKDNYKTFSKRYIITNCCKRCLVVMSSVFKICTKYKQKWEGCKKEAYR